jgi:hypothetical protein
MLNECENEKSEKRIETKDRPIKEERNRKRERA